MALYTPQTNLWLERSRLIGMLLAAASYGAFLLLTIQSLVALTRRPRHGGKIADHCLVLFLYIVITSILVTISTVANAKYTVMIWIDLRDAPGGPLLLIEKAYKHRINVLALCCGHIEEWFMQALLLYRCFVIWNWAKAVMIPMITLYIAMIGLSIVVQVKSSLGAIFYGLDAELAYLCMEAGLTVIYTILVVYRLLSMQSKLKQVMGQCHSTTYYDTIVLMVVESTMAFTIFAIIFIVSIIVENDGLTIICFLSIGNVQGITQLFIILRVATGRAVTQEWSTRSATTPTTLLFSGTLTDATEESNGEGVASPEQGTYSKFASEQVADAAMSIA